MSFDRCIQVDPAHIVGVFANAFRVSQGDGEGNLCLLEFLVYSETEGLAKVVGKVLLNRGLLPRLRDGIREVL